MLSFQAVTLFQVVTKLINRNWFPVQFILAFKCVTSKPPKRYALLV